MYARYNAPTASTSRRARSKARGRIFMSATVLLAICGLAIAHSGATGVVKERMDLMKSVAEQMKTVGKMIKGEEAYAAGQVAAAADAIVGHAREIPGLFPEGSTDHPSEAMPAIWQDWDRFVELTNDMQRKAEALGASARQSADMKDIRPQFGALGKTCSACHEDFRRPE